MAGRWEGRSDDVRCAGDVTAPSSEVAVGRSRAHAWWEKDGLFRIEVDLLWDSGRSDQWFYWFDLEGDRLRFWRAQTDFSNESDLQRFDVEIVSVGSDGVTFFQRYDQGLRRTRVISLTHAGRDFRLASTSTSKDSWSADSPGGSRVGAVVLTDDSRTSEPPSRRPSTTHGGSAG